MGRGRRYRPGVGTHPDLRTDVSLEQAKKEVADHLVDGQRLRQDARRVRDQFDDPMLTDMARTIIAEWSVESWIERKRTWVGLTSSALRDIFSSSQPAETFEKLATGRGVDRSERNQQKHLDVETAALDSGLDQLQSHQLELGQATGEPETKADVSALPRRRRVFVVHGRDERVKLDVLNTLKKTTTGPYDVVTLDDIRSRGRTVIEKFEQEAASAVHAVILLTADDVGRLGVEPTDQPRVRQNVLFEFGWFVGRLGRRSITLVAQPGVEIPSDFEGVMRIPLDDAGSWRTQLVGELRAADLPFDANKL
jgi:predicted nucleotide-binding protein